MRNILATLGMLFIAALCLGGISRSANAQPAAGNEADQSAKAIRERLEKQGRLNEAVARKNAPEVKIKVEAELNVVQLQVMAQLKPFMKVELAFVTRACGLDKEQRKRLAELGDEVLQTIVRQQAPGDGRQFAAQVRLANGAVRVINGNSEMSADTRKLVEDRVAVAFAAALSAEQAERYKTEQAERAEFRKRATIDNVVCLIDKKVMLGADQRESIRDALVKKWAGSSLAQIDISMYADNALPLLRDDCVVPFLRDNQKAVWMTRQVENRVIFTGGVNFAPGFEMDDVEIDHD